MQNYSGYKKIAILILILLTITLSFSCRRRGGGGGGSDEPSRPSSVEKLTILSVTPNSGPLAGGIPGLVRGKKFTDGAVLTIGGNEALDMTVNSSEEISFMTPPGNIGAQEVRVTNPDGETAILSPGFTYIPGEGLFVIMGFLLPPDNNRSNKARLGDLDGDGDLDIFVANKGQNNLYINDGNGGFEDRTIDLHELEDNTDMTRDVRFGDINGDGAADIVIANDFERDSKIYINNGDGTFSSDSTIFLSIRGCSKAVDLGDIDNDGDLDILIVNFYNSSDCPQFTRLLMNDGIGNFTDVTKTNLPEGLSGRYQSIAGLFSDINGDGYPDIIIANLSSNNLLYINNGDGSFRDVTDTAIPPTNSADTTAISTGDIDGDGDMDIIFFTLDKEVLFLNDGNGVFTDASVNLPDISDSTWDGRLIDIDSDKDLDILKINNGQNLIYINDGKGRFFDLTPGRVPIAETEGMGIDAGDINGDGYTDIIIANGNKKGEQNRIYFGNGQGSYFDATGNFPIDTGETRGIDIGDIDGDGNPDIVLANYKGEIRLFFGDSERNFSEAEGTPIPVFNNEDAYEAVSLFDIDMDSDPDLIIIKGDGQHDRLYRNDSDQQTIRFTDITASNLIGQKANDGKGMAYGDIDGDGDMDMVIADIGREIVWINDGAGGFIDETEKRLPAEPDGNTSSASVLLADLNSDGYPDIFLSNNNISGTDANKQNRLYINDRSGRFTDVTNTNLPSATDDDTMETAAADIDGDGDLDLAIANDNFGNTCKNRIYINEGDGHFTDVSSDRIPPDCDGTRGVSFLDAEGDGDMDIIFANDQQDRLYLNDGTGVFIDSTRNLPKDLDNSFKVRVSDLDADGDQDIVIANEGQDRIYVNINR
ncbi:MAG: FG-GAP-like repeat-containing protein [Nitrospirota bacterium]